MRHKILDRLFDMEDKYNVKVLFAIESGSRAWGFESKNSDYDVRFIFKRRLGYYLQVNGDKEQFPDVIEDRGEVLDLEGWDIRKALHLMGKCNPALYEWMRSPITYVTTSNHAYLQNASEMFFNPATMVHHYRSMAKDNFRDYLQGDEVQHKRYLYVIRALLCVLHMEKNEFESPPPVVVHEMLDLMYGRARKAFDDLLEKKMAGEELDVEPKIPALDGWILGALCHVEDKYRGLPNEKTIDERLLNRAFLDIVAPGMTISHV